MKIQWDIVNQYSQEEIRALAETLRIPPVIAKILLHRGINDLDTARKFFRSSMDHLYDPFLMKDMDRAVERLRRAVLSDERILIYGDYDVDGITSVSFLYLILKELGAKISYYIPDRQVEGYGLSQQGIEEARNRDTNLIVTVDCGITAHTEVELAKQMGIDVLICDHHEPGPVLPDAVAALDPKRPDCSYPFKELAGVGAAYKLCQGLLIRMEIDLSILENYLELVAIGTAADIVSLIDENRIFVRYGLQRLNETENVGLKTLLQASSLYGKDIGTGHVVFIIAPRINAVGRMGNAERAVKLLTTEDQREALRIAEILEQENRHRKNVDEETYRQALALANAQFDELNTYAFTLYQNGWHPGVIGIVASRVVEKFYRPTVLISIENGIGKGSARSVAGFDLYDALKECEDLLMAYGGHKYAAGLSIEENKIEMFKQRFEQIARNRLQPEQLIPKLIIEAELKLNEIDGTFIKLLKKFAPFGPQNMRPVFVSKNLQVLGTPSIVGGNHLKFKVRQQESIFDVIGFGMGDKLYRLQAGGNGLELAYVVEENEYMGRKVVQLRAKDLR